MRADKRRAVFGFWRRYVGPDLRLITRRMKSDMGYIMRRDDDYRRAMRHLLKES